MQFLDVPINTRLQDLRDRVGKSNLENILHENGIERAPNIGEKIKEKCEEILASVTEDVPAQRKISILNRFTDDSDIFEHIATAAEFDWKLLSEAGMMMNKLFISSRHRIPDGSDTLGNRQKISTRIHNKVVNMIKTAGTVDPSVFNNYSSVRAGAIANVYRRNPSDAGGIGDFPIPWGKISLYSSISGEMVDFPVYPEEYSDGVKANYTQMPDMIYQYEPWNIYTSSGPRTNTFTFNFHRDMWQGDHRQGGANNLIRFCEANCYPKYNGSAVIAPTVTLYIEGKAVITGIMNEVTPSWDGPIGQDGWYLHCTLTLSITEVSTTSLNYDTVRNKPLIG